MVPAPFLVKVPVPAKIPAMVSFVFANGATVILVLDVIVVPALVLSCATFKPVADSAPAVTVKEPPVSVVMLTVPVCATPVRPATESLNMTALPPGITTADTLLKSGTAPDKPKLTVTAQLAGLNH